MLWNAQVAELVGNLSTVPDYHSLRHPSIACPGMDGILMQLPRFRLLETLSLTHYGDTTYFPEALDAKGLMALKHIHLGNIAPRAISAPKVNPCAIQL